MYMCMYIIGQWYCYAGAEAVKGLVPALVEKLDTEEDGNMKVCVYIQCSWCYYTCSDVGCYDTYSVLTACISFKS